MQRCSILLAFAIGLVVIAPATAQAAPGRAAAPGAASVQPLARAAFLATMDAEFRTMDANKDGSVTRAELEAKQQKDVDVAAADRARAAFARIDTDHNGQVSADEFVRATVGQQRKVDGSAMMSRLDANHDQKVSLVEYRTLTLAKFDQLDADKDGIVSPAEQRAAGLAK